MFVYYRAPTMAGELAIDPTRSPWDNVVVDGKTKTRCRYCLQFFTAISAESKATANHFKWCEWLIAYQEDSSDDDLYG